MVTLREVAGWWVQFVQPTLRSPHHFHMSSVVPAVFMTMLAGDETCASGQLDFVLDLRLCRSASPRDDRTATGQTTRPHVEAHPPRTGEKMATEESALLWLLLAGEGTTRLLPNLWRTYRRGNNSQERYELGYVYNRKTAHDKTEHQS